MVAAKLSHFESSREVKCELKSGRQLQIRPGQTNGRLSTNTTPLQGGAHARRAIAPLPEGTDSVAELPGRAATVFRAATATRQGGAMNEDGERRADVTRQRIIAAASRQFAHRPYSVVSLDDILAEAELTKGAMYFHFPSKQALALTIIDDLTELSRSSIAELLDRNMSGLETLIEFVFARAAQDTQDDVARAGVRLLDTLDNPTSLPPTVWQSWIEFVTSLIQKAAAEGDVIAEHDPEDIAKMLVALWVGIRRTSNLDKPADYLDTLQRIWTLALPSFANPDRIDYFTKFIERRQALA
ncbi:TetR/AcrR family transcriptional regulator [Mycobacterium sp. UM_CSW]|nr:TetR/AcrR family transcriptional regulator [Mycobacterium sp. UM_CSW]